MSNNNECKHIGVYGSGDGSGDGSVNAPTIIIQRITLSIVRE
jgi:hypothetical protein